MASQMASQMGVYTSLQPVKVVTAVACLGLYNGQSLPDVFQ